MQGSYKNNGLPRPYYMKPSKRKHSPYDNLKEPVVFFNSPRRKLAGYVLMFLLFSALMWYVSQDLKERPPPEYELVPETDHPPVEKSKNDHYRNLDNIVKNVGSKADKESENLDLAENLAAGSKGEKGLGVAEAPKGGMANEGPVVGSDEDKIVGSGKGTTNKLQQQQRGGQTPMDSTKKNEEAREAGAKDEEAREAGAKNDPSDSGRNSKNREKAQQILLDTL
ncbi:uncharacterized protein LODBEIA_P56130 [Lodderomyces beijingensis]|uniref:Uncharacterized protein n=1 Tax=Lodderomyces beijingensis TaxID=1775926 RepID=A0ABP0ZU22_9ASCO